MNYTIILFILLESFLYLYDIFTIECYENLQWLACSIIPYSINKEERKISPEWLLGFTEAEGTFAIDINDAKDMKLGKKVQLSFIITQHLLDEQLLHDINQQFFYGKGYVENSRDANSKVKRLRIRDFQTIINVVIPFYDANMFYSRKKHDYTDWRTVAFMMQKKQHLTAEGLVKIMEIEQLMNRGRTEEGLAKKIARRLSKSILK